MSTPGAAILSPALFTGAPTGEFSLTTIFDRAAEAGRLHGLRLEGLWMHVGTPEAVAAAEAAIRGKNELIDRTLLACMIRRWLSLAPRVFNIPASAPFLHGLIDALRDGKLVPGFPAASIRSSCPVPRFICRHGARAGWRATCFWTP